jgi:beta-phosphoglucomutase-like phosphatase (HAD superfamily)
VTDLRRARGYAPLDWTPEGGALVARIQALADTAGPGHVAVLDLDGCLFDTRPRQVHIFRELASRPGFERLAHVRAEHFLDWSLRRTCRNAGLDDAWIDANFEHLRTFWETRFFSGAYVLYDHAMPGAPALVRHVHNAGLHVVYLTGRDETMRAGTEEALHRHLFPLGDRATLICKPDAALEDTAFKEGVLETVAALGDVVLYMDNEPANVNVFRRRHPDALVVFVETDHSPRPIEPAPGIPWLRSFLPEPLTR